MNNYIQEPIKINTFLKNNRETTCKFNRPNIKRKYIQILALCLTYAPADLIYQNVKNPIMKQVRDMCREGLLNRYKRGNANKYYYKTTSKGYNLLTKALEAN